MAQTENDKQQWTVLRKSTNLVWPTCYKSFI